jgi:hypothetical protein
MAVASTATRKYKHQESLRPDKVHRDVNSIAACLPDKKDWIAEHDLQMLMLNGCEMKYTMKVIFTLSKRNEP